MFSGLCQVLKWVVSPRPITRKTGVAIFGSAAEARGCAIRFPTCEGAHAVTIPAPALSEKQARERGP